MKERAGEKGVEAGVVVVVLLPLLARGELVEENISAGVEADCTGGNWNLFFSSEECGLSVEEPDIICWRRDTLRADDWLMLEGVTWPFILNPCIPRARLCSCAPPGRDREREGIGPESFMSLFLDGGVLRPSG